MTSFFCNRCGHKWTARKESPPKNCPNRKCNSPYWNKTRIKNMKPATIWDALIYAIKAHKGQIDKLGFPVIFHPIIVMLQMHTDEERALALCHDIPEDTGKSPHQVAMDLGMSREWETWLDAITHKKCEPYQNYIKKIAPYPTAVKVKLADMNHNINRLIGLPDEDQKRLVKKYSEGIKTLSPMK